MKRFMIAAVICLLGNLPLLAAQWATDYNAALKAARDYKRPVLINFTGSDWCGWCIRLKQEVFDTAEFDQFAKSRLVLLEVDFPERKPQSAAQQQANQALAQRYGVRGYPTLFLVDPNGKILQQLGYMAGGPKAFVGELSKTMPPAPPAGAQVEAKETPAPKPTIRTGPEADALYSKVVLKKIVTATKPVALINNKAFTAGESYKMYVGSEIVKVTCVSIAADHVMVKLDDETEPRKLEPPTK